MLGHSKLPYLCAKPLGNIAEGLCVCLAGEYPLLGLLGYNSANDAGDKFDAWCLYLQPPGAARHAPGDDSLEADMLLSILYARMVAEGSKERARLKKRVKRLGVHQVLIEGVAPEAAATFSRGKC